VIYLAGNLTFDKEKFSEFYTMIETVRANGGYADAVTYDWRLVWQRINNK
jgi:hypothetical protein